MYYSSKVWMHGKTFWHRNQSVLYSKRRRRKNLVVTNITSLNSDEWKSFENDIQTLRAAAAAKLSLQKSQDLENLLSDLLLDLSPISGVNERTTSEIAKIPVLETRAAIMTLLISLVKSSCSNLIFRENLLDLELQTNYGARLIVLQMERLVEKSFLPSSSQHSMPFLSLLKGVIYQFQVFPTQ